MSIDELLGVNPSFFPKVFPERVVIHNAFIMKSASCKLNHIAEQSQLIPRNQSVLTKNLVEESNIPDAVCLLPNIVSNIAEKVCSKTFFIMTTTSKVPKIDAL